MRRKIFFLFLTALFLFVLTSPVFAAIQLNIYIDDTIVETDASPLLINNRTMVPLRVIAEKLDAKVEWKNLQIVITKDDIELELTIGSKNAYKNGALLQLETAPFIKDAKTVVPLRFISEGLGADVDYAFGDIYIRSKAIFNHKQTNLLNGGYIDDEENILYWIKYQGDMDIYGGSKTGWWGNLYKTDKSKDEINIIKEEQQMKRLNIMKNAAYYQDGVSLKRLDLITGQEQLLDNSVLGIASVITYGDWIYYLTSGGTLVGKLYKVKLDGSGKTELSNKQIAEFVLHKNCIYYVPKMASKPGIIQTSLNGRGEEYIYSGIAKDISVNDGFIYFLNEKEQLCRIEIDGTNFATLISEKVYSYNIKGVIIYYSQVKSVVRQFAKAEAVLDLPGDLYKMNFSTKQKEKLREGNIANIHIIADQVYYYQRQYEIGYETFTATQELLQ